MAGQSSLKYAGAALLAALCVGGSPSAYAGFQWMAPGDPASAPAIGSSPQQQQPAPPPYPRPQQASSPEVIAPALTVSGGNASPEIISPAVVVPNNYAAPALTAPVPGQPALPANDVTVAGFAKSVPLAVALRQILPSGYAFSIDPDVDMGTLVSFKGGRGWHETLHDALGPVGLAAREQGQMISVGFLRAPPPVPEVPLPAPPPPTRTEMHGSKEFGYLVPPPTVPNAPPPDLRLPSASPPSSGLGETWSAERGERLRKVLAGWSSRANVEFDWMSEYDYPLQASVSFTGNFENAVRSLLTGFQGAHPQPVAELHSNPAQGQTVLVVQTRGNPNGD